jgi:hypothetical protein
MKRCFIGVHEYDVLTSVLASWHLFSAPVMETCHFTFSVFILSFRSHINHNMKTYYIATTIRLE